MSRPQAGAKLADGGDLKSACLKPGTQQAAWWHCLDQCAAKAREPWGGMGTVTRRLPAAPGLRRSQGIARIHKIVTLQLLSLKKEKPLLGLLRWQRKWQQVWELVSVHCWAKSGDAASKAQGGVEHKLLRVSPNLAVEGWVHRPRALGRTGAWNVKEK